MRWSQRGQGWGRDSALLPPALLHLGNCILPTSLLPFPCTVPTNLCSLGAYRHAGRSNPVAAFSAMVCDALPRSWPTAAVGEQLGEKQAAHGVSEGAVGEQVEVTCSRGTMEGSAAWDARQRACTHLLGSPRRLPAFPCIHCPLLFPRLPPPPRCATQLLLQCLQDSGALGELHPSALRLLFQDGQQLAALAELRELLTKGGAAPLQAVVLAAGAAAAAAAVPAVAAAPEDAFFACPLKSVPLFLREVAAAAARLVAQPGRAAGDQAALAALTRAVQVGGGWGRGAGRPVVVAQLGSDERSLRRAI